MREGLRYVFSISLCLTIGCGTALDQDSAATQRSPLGGDSALVGLFDSVAQTWDVPPEILATLAYTETRLRFLGDDAPGHSHSPGTIGMTGLSHADEARSLDVAAGLAGFDHDEVERDLAANLHATAALLAHYRGQHHGDRAIELLDWHPVLAAYGGDVLAREVLRHVSAGWRGLDADGAWLVCSARDARLEPSGVGSVRQSLGYPGAIWNPAHSSNYTNSSRGAQQINYIIIHTTQGSYAGAISWFKNSTSNVSAHYVTRSSDGQITQMVDDADTAWHDACFNSETIGIEHEGFVDNPNLWYTEAMYTESAKLTAWLASQYNIPTDRSHIMGHGEAPDCSSHTDPGSGWDWNHYMALVRAGGMPNFGATYVANNLPTEMTSGQEAVVWFDFVNDSNVTWGLNETRLGTAAPQDRESPFYVEGNWLSPSRPTGADHSNYGPGSTGRFTFLIRAPEVTEPTEFTEAFQLVQEGVSWFGPDVSATIRVVPEGWTEPDPTDPEEPTDPVDPPVGPSDPGDESGGCAAGSGAPGSACAILFALALLATRRRRRRC